MDTKIHKQAEFLKEQIESEESCYKTAVSLGMNYTILRIMKEKIREMKYTLSYIEDKNNPDLKK